MAKRGDKWWVVAAMALPVFILTVDINGVTVALPDIGDDLGASTSELQWVLNAYLLSFAAFLVPAGRLGDIVGRRTLLILGTGIFAVASLAGGLAESAEFLIAARAIQGVGGAMFFATSLSIVSAAFEPAERPRGIGAWTAFGAIGAAAGPIFGGVLTDTLGWEWFFFVNVPIAVIGIVMAALFVPESRDPTASRSLDPAGFVTVTLGLIGVIFAIQSVDEEPAGSPEVLVPLLGGIALLAVFAAIELRRREPLIDLRLFRGRDYLTSTIVGAMQAWAFFGIAFISTLYLQNILDLSAISTGLVFLALSVPFASGSFFMGTVTRWIGLRLAMLIGISLNALPAAMLLFVGTDPVPSLAILVVAFVLFGIGASLAYNLSTTAGMVAISDEKAGAASGILSSARFVGGAMGVALGGAALKAVENDRLGDAIVDAGAPESERDEVQGLLSGSEAAIDKLTELAPGLAGQVERAVDDAFLPGMFAALIVTLAAALVGVVAALAYRERPSPDSGSP